jgi:hypothetical protein
VSILQLRPVDCYRPIRLCFYNMTVVSAQPFCPKYYLCPLHSLSLIHYCIFHALTVSVIASFNLHYATQEFLSTFLVPVLHVIQGDSILSVIIFDYLLSPSTILKGCKSKYERLRKTCIQVFYHSVVTELLWKNMKDNTKSSCLRFSKWYLQFADSFRMSLLMYNQYFDSLRVTLCRFQVRPTANSEIFLHKLQKQSTEIVRILTRTVMSIYLETITANPIETRLVPQREHNPSLLQRSLG